MVTGVNKVVNKFKELVKTQDSKVYDAIKKASQPIITDAQSQINSRTGNLRASIGFIERSKRYKKAAIIGPRTYGNWRGFHAYLIAKGWERKRVDGGLTVVPGNDFMGKAFNKNQSTVKQNLEKELSNLIKQQIKK